MVSDYCIRTLLFIAYTIELSPLELSCIIPQTHRFVKRALLYMKGLRSAIFGFYISCTGCRKLVQFFLLYWLPVTFKKQKNNNKK